MAQFRGACTSRNTRYYMVILIMENFYPKKMYAKIGLSKIQILSLVNTRPIVRKIDSSSQTNFDEKLQIFRKKSKNLDRGLTYFLC